MTWWKLVNIFWELYTWSCWIVWTLFVVTRFADLCIDSLVCPHGHFTDITEFILYRTLLLIMVTHIWFTCILYTLIISCQHWHMPFNHDHTCTLLWFRRHTFLCILTIPRWWWHNKITANEPDSHQMTRWLQILVKLVLTLMISPPLVYTYIPSLYYCAILFINDMVYYWCVVDDPKTP